MKKALTLLGITVLSNTILFKASAQQQSDDTFVTASFHHVGISVNNLNNMENWYKACFNMKEIQYLDLKDMHVKTVLLQAPNGLKIELIELVGSKREHNFTDPLNAATIQGYGHLALQVKDLQKVFDLLIKNGANQVVPPSPAAKKGDEYAYVKDIEGNLIELIQPGS